MSNIGKPERETQNRIIALFHKELRYDYLGDWQERDNNSNIEEGLLISYLEGAGYSSELISKALDTLRREATNHSRSLYENNKAVYELLRYGIPVKTDPSKPTETVHLVQWGDDWDKNNFGIAEEVTLAGEHNRRPDLVLYVNGIAFGVIELKNSRKSIGDGIGQLLSNQQPMFHEWFFSTVQFVFAGSDSEGLKYGTIGTPEKFFLTWKEDVNDNQGYKIDKYLKKMCNKQRILELIHDFVLFDGGVKKVPRVHQYFGIKEAQERINNNDGGIIWHTQGSGKSIVMVLLAKWVLENLPNARVAVITDRDELDKQIKGVFEAAGQTIHRTRSGADLMKQLGQAKPRLLCTLVHKFGRQRKKGEKKQTEKEFEAFIKELESQPSKTVGDVLVFVDECHRTQSGKLHKVMKAMMPHAKFIGFTGTPLLKKDKKTSLEVFGSYIHTYKFSEAVEDKVVLDLIYEARDIDQELGSTEKIDAWFEAKTKGLNDWQKDELKKQWATMRKVLGSKSRRSRIVADITYDFNVKSRLSSERGNAMLVCYSIYDAVRYYALFQDTPLKGKCALITSYNPHATDVSKEETGANTKTDKQFLYDTYTELIKDVDAKPGMSKTETYEDEAKTLFIKQPANMKLLIVVEKLLTGFDAPSCTYLYIDKSMQDHGLFQAICRTNRLDGEDKQYGYIVDYKDMFKNVEKSIAVYTSEIDASASGADPKVEMQGRLDRGKQKLDEAVEQLALLCEPVEQPKEELDYIHYFCGNTEIPDDLAEREPQRVALYKGVASLVRSYANIADDLVAAGYDEKDHDRIEGLQKHYLHMRDTIRNASGETLDLKPYEADMRHLIDTYIDASEPRKISPFDNMGLLDLIVKTGIADAIAMRLSGLGNNKVAIAETIENNVRSTIIQEHLNNPAFYDRMSDQLQEIIELRKVKAIEYEEYLAKINELVEKVGVGHAGDIAEPLKKSAALRAIYDNLIHKPTEEKESAQINDGSGSRKPTRTSGDSVSYGADEDLLGLAIEIDETVRRVKPDGWRGVLPREQVIKRAIAPLLNNNKSEVERMFAIIFAQSEY